MAGNGDNVSVVVAAATSLYVGDLDVGVTDSQLYDTFNTIGDVVSVRVCRDLGTRRSLGYGYVNFTRALDAEKAIEKLNFTPLNNKPIRISYSHRDPSVRKSGAGNVFIKNLDKSIDNKALHDKFSSFGTILSCKIATDPSGQSKGYGFVQYEIEESAQKAIEKLNGIVLKDKQVHVGAFVRKQERDNNADKTKFTNVFVKNLAETVSDEDLAKTFGQFGDITSAVVMRHTDGKSKCFGFVNFENTDSAAKAVDALNGSKFDDKEWYVGKAQKKSEREAELKQHFEPSMKEASGLFQDTNLYLKNLDDNINEEKLKELFSRFGTIASCKVMRYPSGLSTGTGFVAFSTAEEAYRALMEMHGKIIVSKPLFVSIAQRKEERRARLQEHFSNIRPVANPMSIGPGLPPMASPGGVGQLMYYGQARPGIIPAQPGFGYQPQLIPGTRGGAPVQNNFVPMGQRPVGRRTGGGPPGQHPRPMMNQQYLPRGPYRTYRPAREMRLGPFQGRPNTLSTLLANATPEHQRLLLGESLFPMVEQLEPEAAAKVTGMLLELDQAEILLLIESPDALEAKVAEAMEVLRSVEQQPQSSSPPDDIADQVAGLSLTDNLP